ncbi:MAG: tRNA (guanine(9)-N(1))-methyltransferase [Watsoniomyces obsoletus]|nr:MAG: tRNA (guanine(9)-N(1))-methyltransferase [Watsoniomyces obsoletus]
MNGHADSNGASGDQFAVTGTANFLPKETAVGIIQALEVAHSPSSSSSLRQEAYVFLEQCKNLPEAAQYGFYLALDGTQSPVVRHYGLSLLETAATSSTNSLPFHVLHSSLWQLAESVHQMGPAYMRNKIAKIWSEFAKRFWLSQWLDMDEQLVQLWSKELAHKEMVAVILENLADDIFAKDDPVASLRGPTLTRAFIEILVPLPSDGEESALETSKGRVRHGTEGWLARLANFLEWAFPERVQTHPPTRTCALHVYSALTANMTYIKPRSIAEAHGHVRVAAGLMIPDPEIQRAALEALIAIYNRPIFRTLADVEILAVPVLQANSLSVLRQLWETSAVDPTDIQESKYLLLTRISQLMYSFTQAIHTTTFHVHTDVDWTGFMNFLVTIMNHDSLTLSVAALRSWMKIIQISHLADSEPVTSLEDQVYLICSQRLVRYEYLPENSSHPIIAFLNEDFDTLSERHMFLGNYRRYCMSALEHIVRRRPIEGLRYTLNQVDQVIEGLSIRRTPLDLEHYTKNSETYSVVDAQLAAVEAALKGCTASSLELTRSRDDPSIRKRIVQVVTDLSTTTLKNRTTFALDVLKFIFTQTLPERPEYPNYFEAVKDLQTLCNHELHQMAIKMPNFLTTVYQDLEAKISEMTTTKVIEARQTVALQSFLFIITHRSTAIDDEVRARRLVPLVESIHVAWQNPELDRHLESFEGFCALIGVGKAQQYLGAHKANEVKDWSTYNLDDEGKQIQAEMIDNLQSFLGASVEKLRKGTPAYAFATELWRHTIPVILPRMIKLLGFAHAYHNIRGWTDGSPASLDIASRTLHDRFWQSGISSESRESFYAKLNNSRKTLEGFASNVRGAVRSVRETCYAMLYSMSRFDMFYSYEDLPVPLAQAICADAPCLSPHQFTTMISMARYLIEDCPSERREVFLTPLLSQLLTQIDNKVKSEWDRMKTQTEVSSGDEELTEEMRDESVLRHFTHSSVLLVAGLLDPQRISKTDSNEEGNTQPPETMRSFVLSSIDILRPLMSFCTHMIQVPDTRSCGAILRVLRSICADFTGETELAHAMREYMCNDVLRASIYGFNDPLFVDVQRDAISLVVTIYTTFSPLTSSARTNLLALPKVTEQKMDEIHNMLFAHPAAKQSRGLMMSLLDGVRAMSISEQGKLDVKVSQAPGLTKSRRNRDKGGRGMGNGTGTGMEETMDVEGYPEMKKDRESPDFSGIADMFA